MCVCIHMICVVGFTWGVPEDNSRKLSFSFWCGFYLIWNFWTISLAQSQGCLFVCLVLVFRDRVSLCSPGCPGTHFVNQAGLELRNPPASASRVLGLKACATTPGWIYFLTACLGKLSYELCSVICKGGIKTGQNSVKSCQQTAENFPTPKLGI